jgi:RNA polymerase sigma factor (sigma-70 family)
MDRRLIIEHIPRLRRYARALVGDRYVADDLVQDTLERAWNKFYLWRPGSDLRAWLFTIMHNVFVNQARRRHYEIEQAMDELAHAAGQDPVAYRRALLGKNPRSLAVLNKAAQASGWGKPLPPRCARGISLHDSFGTHAALVMEGEVDTQGEIHLRRATAAVDCGIAVNLRQMIEARIERLSKEEQRVVEVASVVGVTFSAACVAAAAQMDEVDAEDVCEELSRRHLILRPVDSQRFAAGAVSPCWEFEHALYRKVLYERLGQGRRARVHRHVGER